MAMNRGQASELIEPEQGEIRGFFRRHPSVLHSFPIAFYIVLMSEEFLRRGLGKSNFLRFYGFGIVELHSCANVVVLYNARTVRFTKSRKSGLLSIESVFVLVACAN